MSGIERIRAERARQIAVENWNADHDDVHNESGELERAGWCYEVLGRRRIGSPPDWPWDEEWWKPSDDDTRNLEKAGALYLAEIDRLTRRVERVAKRIDYLTCKPHPAPDGGRA